MKSTPTLVEFLLPVRNRLTRDGTVGTYNVSAQTRSYEIDGSLLPNEIRASDGSSDGSKITDKTVDFPP